MADDFMLVTSSDWEEVPDVADHINNNIGSTTLQGMISDGAWDSLASAFGDVWVVPEGKQLAGARLVNDDTLRFFVKLLPV